MGQGRWHTRVCGLARPKLFDLRKPATIISNPIPNRLDRAKKGPNEPKLTSDAHLLFTLGPAQISHCTALRDTVGKAAHDYASLSKHRLAHLPYTEAWPGPAMRLLKRDTTTLTARAPETPSSLVGDPEEREPRLAG
jgi:hypothetical protein